VRIAIWENLPPGGAKRAAFELGRALAGRHEVDLYRLTDTSHRAYDLQPFVHRVHAYRHSPVFGLFDRRLAQGRLAPRSLTVFGSLRRTHQRIAADIRRGGYDVVLANTDGMTQSPYLLRWLAPVPRVYFCQEVLRVVQERGLRNQWRRQQRGAMLGPIVAAEDRLVLRFLAAADRRNVEAAGTIVVNSRYMRERVLSAYGRPARVCYLGVDIDRFRPDPSVARVNEVLSIGSPLWIKGHDLVIDALALLPSDHRPALRVIAQAARGSADLESRARRSGVRLEIESGVDEARLVQRYRRALATIGGARLEPFGFTVLESMACGTPVIAIDEGGYRETVVPGKTGLLVAPEPAALSAAIAQLAMDPERARSMGVQGRARVARCWTWSKSVTRLETILKQAVA